MMREKNWPMQQKKCQKGNSIHIYYRSFNRYFVPIMCPLHPHSIDRITECTLYIFPAFDFLSIRSPHSFVRHASAGRPEQNKSLFSLCLLHLILMFLSLLHHKIWFFFIVTISLSFSLCCFSLHSLSLSPRVPFRFLHVHCHFATDLPFGQFHVKYEEKKQIQRFFMHSSDELYFLLHLVFFICSIIDSLLYWIFQPILLSYLI